MNKFEYQYTSEAMLDIIERQKNGEVENFILRNLSEADLNAVKTFVVSFAFGEEERLRKLAHDIEDAVDEHWRSRIRSIL